jgi:hypothetical protein
MKYRMMKKLKILKLHLIGNKIWGKKITLITGSALKTFVDSRP